MHSKQINMISYHHNVHPSTHLSVYNRDQFCCKSFWF